MAFVDGWPSSDVFDELKKTGRLEGEAALEYLSARFSDATKNSYDAPTLYGRVAYRGLKVIVVDTEHPGTGT